MFYITMILSVFYKYYVIISCRFIGTMFSQNLQGKKNTTSDGSHMQTRMISELIIMM